MSAFAIALVIFAMLFVRGRSRRYWGGRGDYAYQLVDRLAKLETTVAELQEQVEQDRVTIGRLEEERDFLRQLYPAPPKESPGAT
jgi:hypothetical protein